MTAKPLVDRLRELSWIPDAQEAADEIERLEQCHREGWRYAREIEDEYEKRTGKRFGTADETSTVPILTVEGDSCPNCWGTGRVPAPNRAAAKTEAVRTCAEGGMSHVSTTGGSHCLQCGALL